MTLEDQIDLHLAAEKDKILSRIKGIENSVKLISLTVYPVDTPHRLADEILWLCEWAKGRVGK